MKKILFVDDDANIRKAFAEILAHQGFEVTTLDDGMYVPEELNKKKYDLVITDIVMPGKEGVETIMEIRERDPNIKILAISGGGRISSFDHLIIAKKLGADQTLEKPFDGETLVKKIAELLPD